MLVSDYVVKWIARRGVKTVFTLSGGGIMYLLDALGRAKDVSVYCNYHEQACAIAAEGYSRLNGFGVCMATTGPGAINAISGIVGAWYDSVPMLLIVGQVKTSLIADYAELRQKGPQECNALGVATAVTKWQFSVRSASQLPWVLEKAYREATTGVPGPVIVEIPLDIQSSELDEGCFELPVIASDDAQLQSSIANVLPQIKNSRRPVLLLGEGARDFFTDRAAARSCLSRLGIPVLLTPAARDLVPHDWHISFGVFGTAGERQANMILQTADLILDCGAGLSVTTAGFEVSSVGKSAVKIGVAKAPELLTGHGINYQYRVIGTPSVFLKRLLEERASYQNNVSWRGFCEELNEKYFGIDFPVGKEKLTAYDVVRIVSDLSNENDIIVTGNGIDSVAFGQAFKIKDGQRALLNASWGSMGWELPLAVGACVASNRRVVCITGDGGVILNIQELTGIGGHNLNCKIIIINNDGYGAIRATQTGLFDRRFVGVDSKSGVFSPDFESLSRAFGLSYGRIASPQNARDLMEQYFKIAGPVLIEIDVDAHSWISPKATSFRDADGKMRSRELDDMAPLLDRAELEGIRTRAAKV
jgi:acetolactate synthase-1/2/3 large subunit